MFLVRVIELVVVTAYQQKFYCDDNGHVIYIDSHNAKN